MDIANSLTAEPRASVVECTISEASTRELLRDVASAETMDAAIDAVANGVIEHLGASTSRVYFADAERRELRLAAHRHVPPALVPNLVRMSFDDAYPEARAARSRAAVALRGGALLANDDGRGRGGTLLALPLIAGSRVIGAVSAALPERLDAAGEARLNGMSDVLGALLERAALRAELADRRRFDELASPTLRAVAAAFEQAFELAWLVDAGGRIIDVNAAAIEFGASSARDLRERLFWDAPIFAKKAVREEVRAMLARAARGTIVRAELEVRGASGPGFIELAFKPIAREADKVALLVAEARDVSDRRRYLRSIDEERRWLRTVIESAPIGFLLIGGAHAETITLNPRAREILGEDNADELRTRFADATCFFGADGRLYGRDDRVALRVLKGETVVGEEEVIRRTDGAEVHVLVNGSPVHDGGGALIGGVVSFDDISALKRLQKLREEWTRVVAHDLKQPLAAIQMHARLLVRRDATGQHGATVAHIESSAELLARMVSDLEDLSLLESRDVPLARAPLDLGALLSSVVQRASVRMPNRPLRLEARGDVTQVPCDPQRIEQVVGNLIANADKYGAADSEIVVAVDAGPREVVVAVINEGPEIPPAERERVFARFHRVPGSPRGRGLGLGLYISRGLVEAHGGRIWVERDAANKTRVCFSLPLARETAAPRARS